MTKMKRKKMIRWIMILGFSGILIGGGVGFYMFNMPHRDISKAKADYAVTADGLVNEFISDYNKANEKYLATDGNSKILEVSGKIHAVSTNMEGMTVLILKEESASAGVSCTISESEAKSLNDFHIGQSIALKGVIRSGASFDQDLGMFEHVILEKCTIVSK